MRGNYGKHKLVECLILFRCKPLSDANYIKLYTLKYAVKL